MPFAPLAGPGDVSAEQLAFVVGFCRLSASSLLVAVVQVCDKVPGTSFWRRGFINALIKVDQIRCTVAYADFGEQFAAASTE